MAYVHTVYVVSAVLALGVYAVCLFRSLPSRSHPV